MKNIILGTILVALNARCWMGMAAQDTSTTDKSKAAPAGGQEMSMPMPKPAPEMTKLIKMMAGNWTVSEKSLPNPTMPAAGSGTGTAKLWPGPGGMSLLEKYHSTGLLGSDFSGFGTFWWNAKEGVYRGMWCDTMTPGGCDASGTTKWEGEKLVGIMQSEMDGKMMMTRFTYSDWTPTSFVMTMEMGSDASSLKPAMTITYTKTSGDTMADEGGMKH